MLYAGYSILVQAWHSLWMPGFFTRVRPEWSLLPELMSRVALCYTRAPNGITVSESRTRERQYHQRLPLSSSPYPRVAGMARGIAPAGGRVGAGPHPASIYSCTTGA